MYIRQRGDRDGSPFFFCPFFGVSKPPTMFRGFFMFGFEANEAVIIEQQKALEAALSTNPKAEKVLRTIIRKYIAEAREQVVRNIRFKSDPRGAANAVRSSVYKKVFGGNLNIYSSRKAHQPTSYEPPRKLKPGQRGGNRLPRSAKTQRMMSYGPLDRGMILRWQNSGTSERTSRYGNRGSLAARSFFRPLGDRAFGQVRENLANAIEREMEKLLAAELAGTK